MEAYKMLNQSGVSVIARLTFREASRRWILWVALLLGLLFLLVYASASTRSKGHSALDAAHRGP
jgi:hypothetical protein